VNHASTNVRRGVAIALGTALISGLAVYLNAFGVRAVPDAAVYTTAKNVVAALILLAAALALPGGLTWPAWRSRRGVGLLAIAIIGGSVPFILFFSGLAMATAPTAAFIHKTLFIWVAMLAVPLLGERLGLLPIAAMAVLLAGLALVAPPTGLGFGMGELMIVAATAMWSVEVIVAKRLLRDIPVRTLAVARMGLGAILLVGFVLLTGRADAVLAISATGWLWVVVTGVILAGYVATWYGALRLAPASVVTSVLVVAAVITGALSSLTSGTTPNLPVVAGYLLIVLGGGAVALAATRVRLPLRDRVSRGRAGV
jgi:drug/metabolite transporter (DMT)-like permease